MCDDKEIMWKLVKIQGGNRKFNFPKYIQINKNLRNDYEEDSQINTKLTKSMKEFLHNMTLTLDSKSREAEDFFSSTTKTIEESLRTNNQFLNKEINNAKKLVLQSAKISENELEIYSACVNQYNAEIQNIKNEFSENIKSCTEETVIELETVRSKYENDLQEVRDLKKLTTRALKECLDKKGNIKPCIDEKIKFSRERFKHILENLQEASNALKRIVAELMKTASASYENAQREVSKNLPKIVEKTKICIDNSKGKNTSKAPAEASNAIFQDDEKSELVLEKTKNVITGKLKGDSNSTEKDTKSELLQKTKIYVLDTANSILHKIEAAEKITENVDKNNNVIKDEKLECLQEAKKDALNSINLVLHEIEAAKKITEIMKKSDESDALVQRFVRYVEKIVRDAKLVLTKCTKEDWKKDEADILKCIAEFFDSIKLKKFELIKRFDAIKDEKKKSSLNIDKALKWISTAKEKLQEVEKIFQECATAKKK